MKNFLFVLFIGLVMTFDVSADGVSEFDTNTRVLRIPLVQVADNAWFSDVELLLEPDGSYELLEAKEITCNGFSPPNPLCQINARDIGLLIPDPLSDPDNTEDYYIDINGNCSWFDPSTTHFSPVIFCTPE